MRSASLWLAALGCAFGSFVVAEEKEPPPKEIPYKTLEGSTIPRTQIVISPKNRNKEDMRLLAAQLKEKHKDHPAWKTPHLCVFVFDNEDVAKMHQKREEPKRGSAAAKKYDKHFLGFYRKSDKQHFFLYGVTPAGVNARKDSMLEEINYEEK
jgi:hypothetical protein